MKNNDDLLSVQGSVYTLVDVEGYLVREDILGKRTRYPIKDDDTRYTAGSGLLLNDNEFSVDQSFVSLKGEVSNKGKIKVESQPLSDGILTLNFDPDYNIFLNEVTLSSGQLTINQVSFNDGGLNAVEEATFESWVTTTGQENISTISLANQIVIIGDFPDTLSGTLTHVFVRRVYKDASSNIHEAISYAYSF